MNSDWYDETLLCTFDYDDCIIDKYCSTFIHANRLCYLFNHNILLSKLFTSNLNIKNLIQLLATDILVLATMKNAAKCDT